MQIYIILCQHQQYPDYEVFGDNYRCNGYVAAGNEYGYQQSASGYRHGDDNDQYKDFRAAVADMMQICGYDGDYCKYKRYGAGGEYINRVGH